MLAAGTVVDGRFRVDREIGAGGFATVFRGVHLTLGAPIALKVLRVPETLSAAERAESLAQFSAEAGLISRVRHPNVVRVFDQGLLSLPGGESAPYLVTEWCDQGSLRDWLATRPSPALPAAEAWSLFGPIVSAVAAAHALGVAHRDLKPGNVMLTRSPEGAIVPRVIDFGIAKLCDPHERAGSGATMTRSGKSPFTPAYAAPEQVAGARTGPWTDVHALALLLCELVVGRMAYDEADIVRAILSPARPTPGRLGVDVGAFEPVLARALALRPADRQADAGALGQALDEAAQRMGLPRSRAFTDAGAVAIEPALAALASAATEHARAGATVRTGPPAPLPSAPPGSGTLRTGGELPPSGVLTGGGVTFPTHPGGAALGPPAAPVPARRPSRRGVVLAAGGVAVAAAVGLGAWALGAGVAPSATSKKKRAPASSEDDDAKVEAPPVPLALGLLGEDKVAARLAAIGVEHVKRFPVRNTSMIAFCHEGVGGVVQWVNDVPVEEVGLGPLREGNAGWLRTDQGLACTWIGKAHATLYLGWRGGDAQRRLFATLIDGAAQDRRGEALVAAPRSAGPVASLAAVTVGELAARIAEAGWTVTREELGCPWRVKVKRGTAEGEIVHFSPLLAWALPAEHGFSAFRAGLSVSRTPLAVAAAEGVAIFGLGALSDPDQLGRLLAGSGARVEAEPPRR